MLGSEVRMFRNEALLMSKILSTGDEALAWAEDERRANARTRLEPRVIPWSHILKHAPAILAAADCPACSCEN